MHAPQTLLSRTLPLLFTAALGALSLSGCGRAAKPWETVFKAEGQVQFRGQPAPGATLILYPQDASVPAQVRPTATADAAGKFTLSTYSQADGAPAGEYRVAVVWHPLVNDGGGPVRGPNKLPAKYSQPDTSGLTVTIDPTENQLPALDLK